MSLELARQVADAVLYEGYVLYPYRASAQKNRLRWQFGVLVPRSHVDAGDSEPWANQTECLLEPGDDPMLDVGLRFLQVQARMVEEEVGPGVFRAVESLEADGSVLVSWDEGVEQEVRASVSVLEALSDEQVVPFEVSGGVEAEPVIAGGRQVGRVVRRREPLSGRLRVRAEAGQGPFGALRLRLGVENVTDWREVTASRDEVLLRSLVAVHSLLSLDDASFVSLLEPPEWARADVESCTNLHTWPVLVGEAGARDVMLSSPIILYDYPQIAAESPGELFDGTEIDEILSLRTMALTDGEKQEARATDARAAQVIDRVDAMPPEMMDRLHGAIRYLREATDGAAEPGSPADPREPSGVPWWDPGTDESVSPETDAVWIGGAAVRGGTRVRLRPGIRRADAQDLFLQGRVATVEAVLSDVDDETYLAVTLEEDLAAELQQAHGRFLYFRPDEVELVGGVVTDRVLVAGVGNIFLGDDGFGSEVARRLATETLPDGVTVIDFGIGGIHLAYELQEGYGTAILVDASPHGEEPGTVYVIEVDRDDTAARSADLPVAMAGALADGHAMEPTSVLDRIRALGVATRILVVGCEPADTDERIGLSPPVHRAVDEAVGVVLGLLRDEAGSTSPVVSAPGPSDGSSARRES